MSLLLQKFTNLFKQKDEVVETLTKLLKPKDQMEYQIACKHFGELILKYPTVIFNMLRSKEQVQHYQPKPDNLMNLLLVFHEHVIDDSINTNLRGQPIYWLARLMDENRESFRLVERMMTEPSTSSFFPQNQQQSQHQPTQTKEDQIQDKRKARIEMNQQLQNPTIATPEIKVNAQLVKPKFFCMIYYSYLQKLSVNVPIYESVQQMQYPYEQPDGLKMKYIWIYKIQNIMGLGLKLLECVNQKYHIFQQAVYKDLVIFQLFIRKEIQEQVQQYATIPNLDCLSLYEVYQEYQRAKAILDNFSQQNDLRIDISQKNLDEFLGFAIKVKVMNQFSFKKSIKVPNRHFPQQGTSQQNSEKKNARATSDCNKENLEQLNIQDFHYDRNYERGVQEKKFYNKSTEQSFEDEQEMEEDQQQVQPQRLMHIKGLSTFYQQ